MAVGVVTVVAVYLALTMVLVTAAITALVTTERDDTQPPGVAATAKRYR